MTSAASHDRDGVLVLAPNGRDGLVIRDLLQRDGFDVEICADVDALLQAIPRACVVVLADEALRTLKARNALREWIDAQPSWSDFPFVLLTSRQSAVDDRNSSTGELLGNATLLERPLHPITLASAVRQAIRARRRQRAAGLVLEAREQAEAALRAREADLEHANETLERRVEERIAELAAANRQLVAQIAERERVEDALRQAQRLEAVGQLTSGVAHDFNNLLTVVLGNIEFLERNAGNDPKARRRLGNVRTAAERGASLTAQLLAFSRRQRLEPKPVDVNKTVSSMSGLLRSTMGGAVRLETILRPDVWPALADETQIEMVILNLAINARDAMSVGGQSLHRNCQHRSRRAVFAGRAGCRRVRDGVRQRHRLGHARRGSCPSL